jgi:hypothetical protein
MTIVWAAEVFVLASKNRSYSLCARGFAGKIQMMLRVWSDREVTGTDNLGPVSDDPAQAGYFQCCIFYEVLSNYGCPDLLAWEISVYS